MKRLTDNGSKIWRFVAASSGGTPIPLSDCQLDELMVFNNDGSGIFFFGEEHCEGVAPLLTNDFFDWTFSDDKTKIFAMNLHETGGAEEELDIVTLKDDLFIYIDIEPIPGGTSVIEYTLVPFVQYKEETIPKDLAGESTKIWLFSEVIINGEGFMIPECKRDELVLYNRDGTGFFVSGETTCGDEEIIHSDSFNYGVNEDGTKVFATNLLPQGGTDEELTIIELTPDVFAFEDIESDGEGGELVYETVMVPYL